MNILPKKSWHVRTRKNIERVHRDEAEARALETKRHERNLEAEHEARVLELRKRAGIIEPSAPIKHFELFQGIEEHQQTKNREHEEEKRHTETIARQREGTWNKLVRPQDVSPWYCSPSVKPNSKTTSPSGKLNRNNLLMSIYDPMTAIKHAEEVVRLRSQEKAESRAIFNDRLAITKPDTFKSKGEQDTSRKPEQSRKFERDSESPEIIGEFYATKSSSERKMLKKKSKHRRERKNGKSSRHDHESHRHHRHHERHKKHKHKRRDKS